MSICISGSPKEIAALALEIQEQRRKEETLTLSQSLRFEFDSEAFCRAQSVCDARTAKAEPDGEASL